MALAPLMCACSKPSCRPRKSLLQSVERQGYVIAATVAAGIVDIGVAWYLIPAHGAVGACIANGAAQAVAVGGMWTMAIYLYKVKLPWLQIAENHLHQRVGGVNRALCRYSVRPTLGDSLGWKRFVGQSCSGLFYFLRVLEPERPNPAKHSHPAILPKKIGGPGKQAHAAPDPPGVSRRDRKRRCPETIKLLVVYHPLAFKQQNGIRFLNEHS